MKHLYIFFFLLTVALQAQAEENTIKPKTDANITGHVINKETKEHIPFLTVTLKDSRIGTATDETGHYFLKNLPLGKHIICVQGLGYKSVEKEVILEKGKTIEVNFEISEDNIMLEETVVTANRNETSRKEAPVVINVLTPKLFENTNAYCLAQGLSFQPGVRVENNCQNCGTQQVRINGLDGPYTQVLIDSRPSYSALSSVYGLEQIPVNMIERVEVMRGGGSALFGSNAIAGTINIITREPLYNFFQIEHNLSAIGGNSFDNVTSFNGAIMNDQKNTGMYLFGVIRDRQPYDNNHDGFTELGKLSNSSLGFRTYYKPTNYSKISLEYHHIKEFRRGGNLLDRPPHEADIAEEADHKIHAGSLGYTLNSRDDKHHLNVYTSLQNIDRDSYYGAGKDPNAYGKTTEITFIGGAQYSYNFDHFLFLPSILTTGVEYSYNKLEDLMLGYSRHINQEIYVYSYFLQNEWKTEHFSFLMGGRMDKNSIINHPIFSPRLNIRYTPTDAINFRASYSEGFRAPQTYDEDLHVAAVNNEVAIIQVAKDLKTEHSRSYSASVDYYAQWGNIQFNLLAEGFYTKLKNIFVLEDLGPNGEGNTVYERRNEKEAVVKGINIEGKFVPHRSAQLQFGATFQSSEYHKARAWSNDPDAAITRKLLRSPDRYGYITSNFIPFKKFSFSISGTYTGPMYVGHEKGYIEKATLKKTPSFFDAMFKVSYDIKFNNYYTVQVSGGIQNLFDSYQNDFDKGAYRDSKYVYGPILPRTYFAGIKFGIF